MEEVDAKSRWETPVTVALTDTDSRADEPDVALGNGPTISGGG
jgi:hypothetical protein